MANDPRIALRRIGTALLVVSLAACTAEVQPTTSPASPSPILGPTTEPLASPTPILVPVPTASVAPSAGASPLASAPASPAATGAASPIASAGTPWQYLADFPAEGAIEVSSVTATTTGFVAVGYEPMPGEGYYGRRQGVVWRSANGVSWERLVPPEFELAALDHVVRLDDQLYAIGQVSACPFVIDEGCTDIPEAGWAIWRSADGGSWEELPQSAEMKSALLEGVVVGPNLLVVYGSAGDDLASAVWLSADGVTWQETRDLAGLNPISAITYGAPGFAAVGTRYNPDLDEIEAIAAMSTDGVAYVPAQVPAGLPVAFSGIAWTEAGYVAVGYSDQEDQPLMAAALVSIDGRSWSAAPAQDGFENLGFQDVDAVPGGYLAIGFVPEANSFDRQLGTTWFSSDGMTWTEVGDLAGGTYEELGGAAVGSTGMAVFATEFDEQGGEEVISTIFAWFAPLDRLAAP